MSPLFETLGSSSVRGYGMFASSSSTTPIATNYWLYTSTDSSGSAGTGNNYIGLDSSDNVLLTGNNNAASALAYSLTAASGIPIYGRYLVDSGVTHLCISYAATGDSSGNAYWAGLQHTASDDYQASFVAKYNSSGTLQWSKTWSDNAGGNNACRFNKIAVDSSNNVYANGTYYNSLTIQYPSLVKYDSNGTLQWSRLISTTLSTSGSNYSGSGGVTTDSSGNVYSSGYFPNYPTPVSPSSWGTGFVVKVNSSGTLQWATQFIDASSSSGVYPLNITTDSSNNVYVVGCANNASNKEVAFLMKLNSSGTLQWQRFLADTYTPGSASGYQTQLNAVSLDSSNNIYVIGNGLNSSGFSTGFIAKYDNSGNIQFQRTLTASGSGASCYFQSGRLDSQNNIIAGGNVLPSTGTQYALAMKLPPSGTFTGTYSTTQATVTYAVGSWTDSAGTMTSSSNAVVLNAATGSVDRTNTLTSTTGGQTTANKILSLYISTTTVVSGVVGTAYTGSVTAGGGSNSYAFTITSGSLPAGLTLNSGTGAITGTPTSAGNTTAVYTATDNVTTSGVTSSPVTIGVTAPVTPFTMTYMIAGGGGGGGYAGWGQWSAGGGGGGGGVASGTVTASGGTLSFSIGAGSSGGSGGNTTLGDGGGGRTGYGGGLGGNNTTNNGANAQGGGGGGFGFSNGNQVVTGTGGGSSSPTQGQSGGNGAADAGGQGGTDGVAGGGGGGNILGAISPLNGIVLKGTPTGGRGGDGVAEYLTSNNNQIGGGGGGGAGSTSGYTATGGAGYYGGGAGASAQYLGVANGANASINTGGGGGGGATGQFQGGYNGNGGSGGSGVIYISWVTAAYPSAPTIGGGAAYSSGTNGSNTWYRFTSTGSITF